MVAELPAIVAHSILEIVRGTSYEVVNVEIRGFSTPYCTHQYSAKIVDSSCQLFQRNRKRKSKSVLGHWYRLFLLYASGRMFMGYWSKDTISPQFLRVKFIYSSYLLQSLFAVCGDLGLLRQVSSFRCLPYRLQEFPDSRIDERQNYK